MGLPIRSQDYRRFKGSPAVLAGCKLTQSCSGACQIFSSYAYCPDNTGHNHRDLLLNPADSIFRHCATFTLPDHGFSIQGHGIRGFVPRLQCVRRLVGIPGMLCEQHTQLSRMAATQTELSRQQPHADPVMPSMQTWSATACNMNVCF